MWVVLVSPQNYVLPCAFSPMEPSTNNMEKYNALLIGIKIEHEIGIQSLELYNDSMLIIN